MLRVGRIPYINCFPVYGAIDRGIVPLDGRLITGIPTALNRLMADGALDVSVVSAVEYARDAKRYLLLPELGITSDGPVRSVMLFSKRPPSELGGHKVIVSRSSMTSVALLELLFENVWRCRPEFVLGDAELSNASKTNRIRRAWSSAAPRFNFSTRPIVGGHGPCDIRSVKTWAARGKPGRDCHSSSRCGSRSVVPRCTRRCRRTPR